MSATRRILPWLWTLVPVAALVFMGWCTAVRVGHIDRVTALAGGAELAVDASSPTGYAGGVRPMVVPLRDPRSLQWIVQAQELEARDIWRLDHVGYDNAPAGRGVWTPSPYRWWLVLVGRIEAAISGRPTAAGIERAALWADPLLQLCLVLGSALLVWRWFGLAPAAWCGAALALFFPLGVSFLPGRPDEGGLALLCAVGSTLPLVVALSASGPTRRGALFVLAGAAGGLGFWVNINTQILVLAGTMLAGGLAAWWRAEGDAIGAASWRWWAGAGAVVCLVGWLVEQAPDRLSLAGARWDVIHPGYALAWCGAGEVLARLQAWAHRRRAAWTLPAIGATALGVIAIAVPLALAVRAGYSGIFGPGETLARVDDLSGDVVGGGILTWLAEPGRSLARIAAVATVVAGCVIGGLVLVRRVGEASFRRGVVFAGVLALVACAASLVRPGDLAWGAAAWALVLVPLSLALRGAAAFGAVRVTAIVAGLVGVGCGAAAAWPRATAEDGVSRVELRALIERDLAWWLANQAPERDAIVLAPPDLTSALIYHAALRGLGSPYRESEDGFRFSVRLSAASTPDEGQALVESRGVRYIVVPSWDDFLDQYARLGAVQPEKSLIALLHQWQPPRWLRAVPYQMPHVEGFSGESVVVFQVVDLQDNATALSRLAEYFVEVGQLAHARRLASALKELYPTEPAAFVARAQVAIAVRDAGGFREIIEGLMPMLEDGSAETLTWDRRVGLALVLSQARRADAAQAQAQRCLDEIDETALRSLTNLSLHRYLVLLRSLGLEIADPDLRAVATQMLPPELRAE